MGMTSAGSLTDSPKFRGRYQGFGYSRLVSATRPLLGIARDFQGIGNHGLLLRLGQLIHRLLREAEIVRLARLQPGDRPLDIVVDAFDHRLWIVLGVLPN